jgi:phosphoribosylanthranilate isomerase
MKVKICGIQDVKTAIYASDRGADFLGFNFSPLSHRCTTKDMASLIYNSLVQKNLLYSTRLVALFYKTERELIKQIIKEIPFHYIQILDSDTDLKKNDFEFFPKIVQVSIQGISYDSDFHKFDNELLILDSYKKGIAGGTGEVFNWDFISSITRKYFLAGGLTPENVKEAIDVLNPFGVDVATGVETDKVKDLEKIKRFIKNAKRI